MSSFLGFLRRNYWAFNPPRNDSPSDFQPIKFGILGAAAIAPPALIAPAKSHPETIVYAVAARDKAKADAFAKKHGIQKTYGGANGYQELLDDPEVDAIYNPLPNGLHYEWTMKALAAGKHVLLEKPSANTAEETRKMFELAERKGLVLLEAFHYRFHPAIQRVKQILDSGELGAIKSISASLGIPKGLLKSDDIRYNYELGGGAMMDMGCYTMNCIRYLASANPTSVISATHTSPSPPADVSTIDRGTSATLALPKSIIASLFCDLGIPFRFGVVPAMPQMSCTVECEGGELKIFNYIMPTAYHWIRVSTRDARSGGGRKTRTEKVYKFAEGMGKGEDWWTTYRFQLEAFIDKIRGRQPQTWITSEDSIANMKWIEEVYAKTGLGSRPSSTFVSVN